MAHALNEINIRRQTLSAEVLARAQELAQNGGKCDNRIIVLDDESFPAGIVGLAAGKLVEIFGRPVLLLERGEEVCRGSARSIAGFSIFDALTECADVFTKFGGHAMAAGFTLPPGRLAELETRLQTIGLRDLTDEMLEPRLAYDARLELGDHSFDLIDQVSLLEPFGHGNAEPLWASFGLHVVDTQTMGKEKQHLKLRVRDDAGRFGEVVAWRQGHRQSEFMGRARVDVAYTLEINEWNNRQRIQMNAKHLQRTKGESRV